MGLNLSAYISANEARQAALNFHGRVMRWGDVVELVRHHWFANGVPYPKPEAKPDRNRSRTETPRRYSLKTRL